MADYELNATLQVRVSQRIKTAIEAHARAEGRSIGGMTRVLLEQALDRYREPRPSGSQERRRPQTRRGKA